MTLERLKEIMGPNCDQACESRTSFAIEGGVDAHQLGILLSEGLKEIDMGLDCVIARFEDAA